MSSGRAGKLRRLMQRYGSAQEFASARLSGYGAKSANAIVGIIDAASRTRLDLNRVRQEVRAHGKWYFLHRVAVSELNYRTHGKVVPSGSEDLSRPIVIGLRGEVLDGRHRVALAVQTGVQSLPAYVPAERLYRQLVEAREGDDMSRELLEERLELLEGRKAVVYEYGVSLRPVSFATVPKGYIGTSRHPEFRHGLVIYDRKLSRREQDSHHLVWLPGRKDLPRLATKIVKGMDYVRETLEEYDMDRASGEAVIEWEIRDKLPGVHLSLKVFVPMVVREMRKQRTT